MALKSKISGKYYAGQIAAAGILLFFSFLLLNRAFSDLYWDLIPLVLGTACLLGALWLSVSIAKVNVYLFSNKAIEVYSVNGGLKRTINYADIKSVKEFPGKSYFLLIELHNGDIVTISGGVYDNFISCKAYLEERVPFTAAVPDNSAVSTMIKAAIPFIFIGALCLVFYFLMQMDLAKVYQPAKTATFSYIQHNNAIVDKGRKGHRSIKIEAVNCPGLVFNISGDAMKAFDIWLYTENVVVGDTLLMTVPKYDYECKIAKTREPDFWHKHIGYKNIDILGLQKKDKIILLLSDYNKQISIDKEDKTAFMLYFGWFLLISGFALLILERLVKRKA
jgi:hypothetical protein